MRGDTLLCSSRAPGRGVAVGPVDVASPSGAQLRLRVQLPFSQDARYLLSRPCGATPSSSVRTGRKTTQGWRRMPKLPWVCSIPGWASPCLPMASPMLRCCSVC